ncbi:MAG: LOG family protein [Planctomycetaceae bacterium]|nr:LOG family protein [Planctomycetaceae bacterium]
MNMEKYLDEQERLFRERNRRQLTDAPSYVLAYDDKEFLNSPETRQYRIQLEVAKPEMIFKAENVRSTVIVFGSARLVPTYVAERMVAEAARQLKSDPNNPVFQAAMKTAETKKKFSVYYDHAREFAQIVSRFNQKVTPNSGYSGHDFMICTGGGPGIMEAANRGAHDIGVRSIGLNIKLPFEQHPNPFISSEFCFQFHYFGIRKLHFLLRAKALVVFPGGFGTLDELFEGLTLRQTHRMQQLPIVLFGEEFWHKVIDFEYLVECGMIDEGDVNLFTFVETPQQAWDAIVHHHTKRSDPAITGIPYET